MDGQKVFMSVAGRPAASRWAEGLALAPLLAMTATSQVTAGQSWFAAAAAAAMAAVAMAAWLAAAVAASAAAAAWLAVSVQAARQASKQHARVLVLHQSTRSDEDTAVGSQVVDVRLWWERGGLHDTTRQPWLLT